MAKKAQTLNLRLTASEKAELKLRAKDSDSTLTKLLMNNIADGSDILLLNNILEDISLKLNKTNGRFSTNDTIRYSIELARSIQKRVEELEIPETKETVLSVIKRVKANQKK